MLLRAPTPLLLGPIPVAWAVTVVGPVVAPLLFASGAWVLGVLVVLAGAPLSYTGGRALHGLARRWVVFVPAGLVLHDLQALAEPVLFPRATIARLGPALGDGTDALDLTLGSLGLALQLDLREPITVGPRHGRRALELTSVARLAVHPLASGCPARGGRAPPHHRWLS